MREIFKTIALECARVILEKKGQEVQILEFQERSGVADFFVVATGTASRQLQAMTEAVEEQLKQHVRGPLHVEGNASGRWVVIDCGGVVVHLFLDELRQYYQVDRLWAEVPRLPIPVEFYSPQLPS